MSSEVSAAEGVQGSGENGGDELGWGWQLAGGIGLVVLGTIALSMPFVTTLATYLVLGYLLIFGGIIQMVYAIFFTRKEGGSIMLGILLGSLYLIIGILMVNNLPASAISVTALIAIFFLIEGIIKMIASFELKPVSGWGWMLTSGIISVLFSFMILNNMLGSTFFLAGLLVGLHLLFEGAAMVVASMVNKKQGNFGGWTIFWTIMLIFFVIWFTLRMLS